MRLFHFSDDGGIKRFEPRPVRTAPVRPAGQEWLNGPLVWAIDEPHAPLYLFPRDCPRILLWPTASTTPDDRAAWWGSRSHRMIAHIEAGWTARLRATRLFRYELAPETFEQVDAAGLWVSRTAVTPLRVDVVENLPAALARSGVEVQAHPNLTPFRGLWSTSLHASGIRLRHAEGWSS